MTANKMTINLTFVLPGLFIQNNTLIIHFTQSLLVINEMKLNDIFSSDSGDN